MELTKSDNVPLLAKKINTMENYDTKGPTIFHLPEAIKFFHHMCNTVNKKHRELLPHPNLQIAIGGSIGELTPATVEVPDLDFVTAWQLDDEVLELIEFVSNNEATNFYKMKIKDYETNKDKFTSLFEPFVQQIQTHGNPHFYSPEANLDTYLITSDDDETYINSNIMRDQMDGILHYLNSLGFKEQDFSETGAARTVTYDLSKILPFFPDATMDYVPQFIIPYKYLPKRLKDWYDRDSVILTDSIKSRIKDRGGVIVAKSPQKNDDSETTWRMAISPGDLINEVEYSGCNLKDALIILKDLRLVALPQVSRTIISSHHIKTCLLHCIERSQNLSIQQLINETLKSLSKSYREQNLPDFFDLNCNLIENIDTEVAQEISEKLNEVLENTDDYLNECLIKKRVFKASLKENILAHGSLKVNLLKMCCDFMLRFSFISSYVVFRIMNKIIYAKWSSNTEDQKEMEQMIYGSFNPELHAMFSAMLKSILNNILDILT